MCETMAEEKIEKIKASSVDIIVEKIDGKPYYSIKYFDLKENQGYIGFGSYYLDYVFEWKDKYFDIAEEEKISNNAMSNDLISRGAAIKAVKTIIQAGLPEDAIYAELEEIPTVYDVDTVCEELEKCIEASKETWTAIDSEQDFGEMMAYQNAIRIVRNGGKKW